jgi:signal transduction histidine kinase
VEIASRHEHGRLRVVVRDNGFGLPADTLNAFNTGVGLSNTRSRLEHLYGGDHRFEFERPAGGGLAVTIVIPVALASQTSGSSPMESVA